MNWEIDQNLDPVSKLFNCRKEERWLWCSCDHFMKCKLSKKRWRKKLHVFILPTACIYIYIYAIYIYVIYIRYIYTLYIYIYIYTLYIYVIYIRYIYIYIHIYVIYMYTLQRDICYVLFLEKDKMQNVYYSLPSRELFKFWWKLNNCFF